MACRFGCHCLLLGLTLASAARTTTESHATAWLKAHQSPDDGDLAELAKADPNSYAIVKALLAKQRMGLLNTQHPSVSAPSTDDSAQVSIAPEDTTAEPMPAPEESSGSHNWLAWKPADDSAMVSGVLGQVAALRGSSGSANLLSSGARVQSTAEQVASADTDMDLSFGAYQEAAKQETKSSFDKNADTVEAGLGKMEAEAQEMDSPSSTAPLTGSGPLGVSMDWSQDGNADAQKKAHTPTASTNSYLSAYPLSMRQQNSPDEANPRNPAQILGAWLQKGKRSTYSPDPNQALEANPYAAMLH